MNNDLRKTFQHYLMQDDYIIFVIDSDQQRRQKSSPLVNEVKQIVKDSDFADKVFFLPDLQEWSSSVPTEWQRIVSRFRTEVESERKRLRDE